MQKTGGRIVQYFCKVKKSLQSQEKICNRYKLNIEKNRDSAVFGRNAVLFYLKLYVLSKEFH